MSHETSRNDESTVLAVEMNPDLKERIKASAKREHRNMSSFALFYLEKAVEASEAEEAAKLQPEGSAQ